MIETILKDNKKQIFYLKQNPNRKMCIAYMMSEDSGFLFIYII